MFGKNLYIVKEYTDYCVFRSQITNNNVEKDMYHWGWGKKYDTNFCHFSGLLLHGLLSSITIFRSFNLKFMMRCEHILKP